MRYPRDMLQLPVPRVLSCRDAYKDGANVNGYCVGPSVDKRFWLDRPLYVHIHPHF